MELVNENRERIKNGLDAIIRGLDFGKGVDGFEGYIMGKVLEMGLEWDGMEWFHNTLMCRVWIPTDEIQLEINIHPDPELFRVVFRSRG